MISITKGFLLFCMVWLLVACGENLTETQHVERAQGYLDKGELKAASIELKNALQQNQDNAQARRLLGNIHLEVGNIAGAEKELRRAIELGLADGSVLPLLARVLLAQGKYDELQALSLEKLVAKDQKAGVLASQGLGKLAQEKADWAAMKIDRALSLDPQSAYAGVAKAHLLIAKEKYDLAQKELDRVLELDGGYAPAWSLLGDLESRDKNLAKAEGAYTKAIDNRANNFSDLLKRAQVRFQQKKYEGAQKDIDLLKKRAPQYSGVNYVQGMIHFQNSHLPDAEAAFELALRANDSNLPAVYYLSLVHLRQGNLRQARAYGNQFLSAVPRSIAVRRLLATIEMGSRQYAEAEKLIRPVVTVREDDVAALNLLANALLKQNANDEAIDLYKKVVSLQPDSATAQLRLGAGLLAGGKLTSGIEHIEKALVMSPQLQQAHTFLVLGYLKQKNYDKALEAAAVYRERHPESAAPYNLIGSIQLVSGQETNATQAFTRAREIAAGDPKASHNLAELAIKKKDYSQARGYYQDVLEYHENHLLTLLKLAALDGMEKKQQALLGHLQQAITAHPKALQPKLMLASYHLAQGEPNKVPPLMVELSEGQKLTPAVLEVMALSYLAQKQFAEAMHTLEQLIKQQPKSAQVHFLLAQAHAGLGDGPSTKKELETAVELAPNYLAARLAFTRLLLQEGQKEKLSDQLAVLNELSPEHPGVIRLKASMAHVEGDQEAASGLLEDLFEKSPTTASMLSVAHQKLVMGSQMEALELQKQWIKEHPNDLTASLALAGAYSQQDQVEQAIAQYQQVLKKDENNVVALNDLAWYLREKQPAEALKYAKRAAVLAPESVVVMDTLALVLLRNGDIERAKRSIKRALAKQPKNLTIRYHNAMIDAAAGDNGSAIKTLQSILGEDSDFPEKAEAKQLLTELQAGAAIATPQVNVN